MTSRAVGRPQSATFLKETSKHKGGVAKPNTSLQSRVTAEGQVNVMGDGGNGRSLEREF